MADPDHVRIRVGEHMIGVIGLRRACEDLASTHAHSADDEVQQALLERLCKKNYIPSAARTEYGRAFVREFRRFLGDCPEEPDGGAPRIVVLGPGCFLCNSLEQTVMRVLTELNLPASLEHVTDVKEIARYGISRLPALIINDKVVSVGTSPTPRRIKELLLEAGRG
jgi:hypothetical protein